jgi:hypothetical protein
MSEHAIEHVEHIAPVNASITPVPVDFNQAQSVIDDLTEQLLIKIKEVAFARTAVKERDAFISANAHLLGMEVGEDGIARVPQTAPTSIPGPNRATRRARTPKN